MNYMVAIAVAIRYSDHCARPFHLIDPLSTSSSVCDITTVLDCTPTCTQEYKEYNLNYVRRFGVHTLRWLGQSALSSDAILRLTVCPCSILHFLSNLELSSSWAIWRQGRYAVTTLLMPYRFGVIYDFVCRSDWSLINNIVILPDLLAWSVLYRFSSFATVNIRLRIIRSSISSQVDKFLLEASRAIPSSLSSFLHSFVYLSWVLY